MFSAVQRRGSGLVFDTSDLKFNLQPWCEWSNDQCECVSGIFIHIFATRKGGGWVGDHKVFIQFVPV
ncbi:hypothetical protein C1J03_19810 [Sulfitobacter sp. SK012]|nr:hypothetical protein C1J03_19810 [Sulfitobacter sp. SK012]